MAVYQFCGLIVADTEAEVPTTTSVVGDSKKVVVARDTGKHFVNVGGSWIEVPGAQATQVFTLPVLAANLATTTDAQTIFFGGAAGLAPGTTADLTPIYVPKTGTLKRAYVFANAGTAGSNEAWAMNLRLNNATDTQIASVSASTANRLWSNTGLSIAVAQGDRLELKTVCPTWATNPANVRFGGVLYVES